MSTFPSHGLDTSKADSATLLNTVNDKYGFVPSLFNYMAEAPAALEAYLNLSGLIAKSSLTPQQAQVVQMAISAENGCDFCTTAHMAMGKMNKANQQSLDAAKNQEDVDDLEDRALVNLARAVVQKRGWLDDDDLGAFFDAGFGHQQVLEVILCVTIKTLSNYTNHLTKPVPNPELVQGAAA